MTRQKIIDSAIGVLNEDLSAPIDRIAEKAGLSRRTLHRYFKDRPSLVEACMDDMMQTWQSAMLVAYNSTKDPVEQLQQMLYAGIDCGVKYAFLNKLHARPDNNRNVDNEAYTLARDKWFDLVPKLQRKKIISNRMSPSWIRLLFTNMIATTIDALQSGDIAPNDVKKLAWYSFSRSIGINEAQNIAH
jgi:AcrR family transcriptional regulator